MANRAFRVEVFGGCTHVGYRKWLKREAIKRGITGHVYNHGLGEVIAQLVGEGSAIWGLLGEMRFGPERAIVRTLRITELAYVPQSTQFSIFEVTRSGNGEKVKVIG